MPKGWQIVIAYVPLALAVLAGAAAWGDQNSTVERHKQRLQVLEKATREQATFNGRIDQTTKDTKEAVDETKEAVGDIQQDIKTLLQRSFPPRR